MNFYPKIKTNFHIFLAQNDDSDADLIAHNFSFCSISQTIREAILHLEEAPEGRFNGKAAIINIGATDIFNGISFEELIKNYIELFDLCEVVGVDPIVTTILPIAKANESNEMMWKVHMFNQFLKENFENVIDMWSCMMCGFSRSLAALISS